MLTRLHKICEIHTVPPNDEKTIMDALSHTKFFVSPGYNRDGSYVIEVFEPDYDYCTDYGKEKE